MPEQVKRELLDVDMVTYQPISFDLTHLQDLTITLPGFQFEDGRVDTVKIHVRPTNHVYSRAVEPTDNALELENEGLVLFKFETYPDNPEQHRLINGLPKISTDVRVFCPEKFESSKNLPMLIQELERNATKACVLANPGDDRSCMTALIEFEHGPEQFHCYLAIFKLHRINATELAMVVETAFLITEDDFRVEKLEGKTARPFYAVLKNVLAKRAPFIGQTKKTAKKRYKKQKKARKAKSSAS